MEEDGDFHLSNDPKVLRQALNQLKKNPGDSSLQFKVAILMENLGKKHLTVTHHAASIALGPNISHRNLISLRTIGRILLEFGDIEGSERFLSQALTIQSFDPVSNLYYGDVKKLSGEIETAIIHWNRVLEFYRSQGDDLQKIYFAIQALENINSVSSGLHE
ncbi:MAG: hypothetical protein ABJA67_00535 [Chthonomonadales bacterium]